MQDYMNAVGETVALTAEELAAFKDVQNIEGYVVDFDTEKVIGVVLEKDGLITKLTIHDNDEQDLTDAMLNMATTISKNNKMLRTIDIVYRPSIDHKKLSQINETTF